MQMNQFYNIDCMEYMKTVPDKYFELAIVDPPYGIGEDGESNHSRGCLAATTKFIPKQWDRDKPDINYFNELFRVSTNQIIWGGNYFLGCLGDTTCMVVWDKENGKTDFADCELAWTSFKTAVRKFKFRWHGMLQEHGGRLKESRIHPAQKPVALYRWLLQNYANPGDKIFDSHVGSGSSIIACIEEGYEYVGCELDKDYYEAASKRIAEHQSQARLFVGDITPFSANVENTLLSEKEDA